MNQRLAEILLPEEIADILRIPVEDVLCELSEGRLNGLRVGGHWRVKRAWLEAFIDGRDSNRNHSTSVTGDLEVGWEAGSAFEFSWPDGKIEKYEASFEADVSLSDGKKHVVIGCGSRDAAGQVRRRIIVFFGEHPRLVPIVEFAGANDFSSSNRVASIIKDRTGHHVRSLSQLPAEYDGMPIDIYSDVVIGPYAARSAAVVLEEDERNTMLRHALIRASYKGWINSTPA